MRWDAPSLVCAGLASILAACGGAQLPGVGNPLADGETTYDCHGVIATATQLRTAPTVAELDGHPAADAFAEHVDEGELDQWRAIVVEDDELAAISELEPADVLDGEVRDHQRQVVTLLDEPAPPESDEEGWLLSSSGACALRTDLGGLESATVHLDPDLPVDQDARQLELLVIEHGCASGQDAAGRVEVDVDEGPEQIRLLVGVQPPAGDQSCPSNPATPVTVELDEPIGDRQVVDAGRYPHVEVTDAPDDVSRGG